MSVRIDHGDEARGLAVIANGKRRQGGSFGETTEVLNLMSAAGYLKVARVGLEKKPTP